MEGALICLMSSLLRSNPDGFEVTEAPRYLQEIMAKGEPRDMNQHFSS